MRGPYALSAKMHTASGCAEGSAAGAPNRRAQSDSSPPTASPTQPPAGPTAIHKASLLTPSPPAALCADIVGGNGGGGFQLAVHITNHNQDQNRNPQRAMN